LPGSHPPAQVQTKNDVVQEPRERLEDLKCEVVIHQEKLRDHRQTTSELTDVNEALRSTPQSNAHQSK